MPLAPISTNIIHVRPGGCPAGVEPRLWRKALSRRVQLHLAVATALLGLLDRFDGDPDIEDNGDFEPSLGAADAFINGRFETDLELDQCDDENTREDDEDELDLREADGIDWGELDESEYDSGALIEGGGCKL